MLIAATIIMAFGCLAMIASIVLEAKARKSIVAILVWKSLPLLIFLGNIGYILLEKVLKVDTLLSYIGGFILIFGSAGIITAASLEAGGLRENAWVVFATRIFPLVCAIGVCCVSLGLAAK